MFQYVVHSDWASHYGNPRDHIKGAGRKNLFVATDDHSRLAFTECTRANANAGCVLPTNSRAFAARRVWRHRFTKPYRLQTNESGSLVGKLGIELEAALSKTL
ncbi:MAG: hypothetical protein H7X91_09530 [Burkholderiales bacterium]|nr:hypothetical protein [Burkholderiales bacterium]